MPWNWNWNISTINIILLLNIHTKRKYSVVYLFSKLGLQMTWGPWDLFRVSLNVKLLCVTKMFCPFHSFLIKYSSISPQVVLFMSNLVCKQKSSAFFSPSWAPHRKINTNTKVNMAISPELWNKWNSWVKVPLNNVEHFKGYVAWYTAKGWM